MKTLGRNRISRHGQPGRARRRAERLKQLLDEISALFLAAVFCAPLVAAIPNFATAPALIIVGALMCGAVASIHWNDFTDAFPAFLTLVATPLTFSIATGLSLGMISFTFLKLTTGKRQEISPTIWVFTALFILRYAFLGLH
jgi:AGZA family xanthine/uracil permease-like MFS transporter